jgi:putative transposase
MPSGLKRYYGRGDFHFITFSCYRRLAFFESASARDVFVGELAQLRDQEGFTLWGYVVMPEHIHLLLGEPPCGDLSTVVQKLKLRVARHVRPRKKWNADGRSEHPVTHRAEPVRNFWQERFYDFNVYSEGKRKEKLNYMHANPVKRGLVAHPKDWAWSSWNFYYGKEYLIHLDV